jgi:hypothetical protein
MDLVYHNTVNEAIEDKMLLVEMIEGAIILALRQEMVNAPEWHDGKSAPLMAAKIMVYEHPEMDPVEMFHNAFDRVVSDAGLQDALIVHPMAENAEQATETIEFAFKK